jgi:hypothetical protein
MKPHREHSWTTSDEEWKAILRLIPGTPRGMCSTSICRRTDHSRLPDFDGIVSWLPAMSTSAKSPVYLLTTTLGQAEFRESTGLFA